MGGIMINIITEKQALELARNQEGQITGLVAVHDGIFHSDDVFFIAALSTVKSNMTVVRTRNPEVLAAADIVGDVGGVFSRAENRYDHHQRGGAGARANAVPFASFGLLWGHSGWALDIVGSILHRAGMVAEAFGGIVQAVDETLVQAVDAADCGYVYPGEPQSQTPRYSMMAAISSFNPGWNEAPDFDCAFTKAVEFATEILRREVIRAAGESEAKIMVRAWLHQLSKNPSGVSDVLLLNTFCPWQEVVINEAPTIKFVVYPSETGDYRVQAVPDAVGSFGMRMALPESWAGLRGMELALAVRTSGGAIADSEAVFCHNGRFIAGATTLGAAMQMAWAATGRLKGVQDRERV